MSNVLSQWIGEYCAPVVVTVTTTEAENICLKNGLLLHELLSAFGHLDNINASIKCGSQNYFLPDAHMRFERVTELKVKYGEQIEEMMKSKFEEFDITRMPQTAQELKVSPPSAWNQTLEQIIMRSLSFSEFELLSNPFLFLTVIATTDVDPIACVQELVSSHHTPTSFTTGQYDPQIHRVFLLLEDSSEADFQNASNKESTATIFRKLQQRFPSSQVKLLSINSLPFNAPNLQQPDMWTRYLIPKYFPQHAPVVDPAFPTPKNPINGCVALGSRLSMEDFMVMREFCISLFNQEIVPCIERRLNTLNKLVNENKKGLKNVMKSFWRKPRDESEHVKGTVRYKYDKIEAQTLLLADTAFIIKDFETAMSMYKYVRDDFRSDKSNLHLAHSCIMMAACSMISEPGKFKELQGHLEVLSQVLTSQVELPHANAYFALLASEMYVSHNINRSPLDSARILMQASSYLLKFPLISGMLMERASRFFLQASHSRRYIFQQVLVGNKIHRCGTRPAKHAAVCFASAMLLLDKGNWGDLKGKLARALAQDLKSVSREGAQRSLILMLKQFASIITDNKEVGNKSSLIESINLFNEIVSEGLWGSVSVGEGWIDCSTRQILLGDLPINPMNILQNVEYRQRSEVKNLNMPELDKLSVRIVLPINGKISPSNEGTMDHPSTLATETDFTTMEDMRTILDLEVDWCMECEKSKSFIPLSPSKSQSISTDMMNVTAPLFSSVDSASNLANTTRLSDRWAETESEMIKSKAMRSAVNLMNSEIFRVALGEEVSVKLDLINKLPMDLKLTKMRLIVEPSEDFQTEETEITLCSDVNTEIILNFLPKRLGSYTIDSAQWNLSEYFGVRQSLEKPGPLLHRTLKQRANKERAEDHSLQFEVVASHALLHLELAQLPSEVLVGQLLRSQLIIRNDGAASACDVFVKQSHPVFVFAVNNDDVIPFYGQSATIVQLGDGVIIPPGQSLQLTAWLRIKTPGLQRISLLASYQALQPDGSRVSFGPDNKCRTSFLTFETCSLPSVGVSLRPVPTPHSALDFTLVMEVANYLKNNQKLSRLSSVTGPVRQSSLSKRDIFEVGSDRIDENYFEISENDIQVVAIWMLGLATSATKPRPQPSPMIASINEKVVGCYPLQLMGQCSSERTFSIDVLSDTKRHRVHSHSDCSWILPFRPSRYSTDETAVLDQFHRIETVAEQFLCMYSASSQFHYNLQESRDWLITAELEADTLGPRSISQVRRDKQKKAAQKVSRAGLVTNDYEEGVDEELEDAVVVGERRGLDGLRNVSNEQEPNLDEGSDVVTRKAMDVAWKEANRNCVNIAIFWSCRWEGRICWGMNSIPKVSLVGGGSTKTSSGSNSSGSSSGSIASSSSAVKAGMHRQPADYLLVGIHYPPTLTLQRHESTPTMSFGMMFVSVRLRNIDDNDILVTVEALNANGTMKPTPKLKNETVVPPPPPSIPSSASMIPELTTTEGIQETLSMEKIPYSGFRWVGKIKYVDVKLPSKSEIQLDFLALFTEPGVFDIKRFKVAVVQPQEGKNIKADMNASLPYFKHIAGQCLVEVSEIEN